MAAEVRALAAARCDEIVTELLRSTGASRTTFRLDRPEWGAHVDDVFAEARAPGVASLVGKTSIRQREGATVKWLERERRLLIQQDCAGADPAPPRELLELYGVRAQMLAPVVQAGELVGWLSVHQNASSRRWTDGDIAALSRAAAAVQSTLDDLVKPPVDANADIGASRSE
jgi:maleate isomerase